MSDGDIPERMVKAEARLTSAEIQIAKLDVKMNLIAFIAGSTFAAVLTLLVHTL